MKIAHDVPFAVGSTMIRAASEEVLDSEEVPSLSRFTPDRLVIYAPFGVEVLRVMDIVLAGRSQVSAAVTVVGMPSTIFDVMSTTRIPLDPMPARTRARLVIANPSFATQECRALLFGTMETVSPGERMPPSRL